MAQEVDEGVSYLKALKQSTSENETAAATASGKLGSLFRGTEKRRSPRFQCEGSAGMRADGTDLQTWARFTDISLHGCYVEAQATYPLGTILHMKLEAHGLRVESKGCVRVVYPHLGMGIAFVEASEETRGRLRQMLGIVARPAPIKGSGVASAVPALDPVEAFPSITNPSAAIDALIEFFLSRQMLMREDFRRILHKSQGAGSKM